MHLNKEQNILKNFWFSITVIPIITFIFIIVDFFSGEFNSADRIIMTYLTIGIISLITQFFFYIKKPIKHSSLNYLYIIFALNISLFIGYILENFIINSDKWYMKWMVNPLIVFVLIFGIKEILWNIINIFYKKRINKDGYQNKLEYENRQLMSQVKELRNEINTLKLPKEKNIEKETQKTKTPNDSQTNF